MKKIMLYAYTHFNLGDDLFINIICERYPKTNFVLFAPREYRICLKHLNNITIIPSDSFFIKGINFILRKLKIPELFPKLTASKCDGAVLIGGSLFIQNENWKEAIKKSKSMQIKNKPFFLLGANFGPYKDRQFYLEYKEVFKSYTDICFREKYTYDLFKDLKNVRIADDIIFQLKNQTYDNQENNIVISVIKPSIRSYLSIYDEIYYQKIKDIAVYFIEKNFQVRLVSFCENEGDKEAINEIIKLIPNDLRPKVTKHLYKYNIEETLNVIANSRFVIATRFHSMILGWVYEKPVFPIIYSDKMLNVMNDVGFKGDYTDFKNLHHITPENVFHSMETNLIDVSENIQNAKKHFEVLDEYLK